MANEELKAHNIEHVLETTYKLYLEYGIDRVTKEMISKSSGLSIKSIHRYFPTKSDCILKVSEWLLGNIRESVIQHFPESVFTDGEYTGVQLLKMYMIYMKKIFLVEPRLFVLYGEFKLYIYRNYDSSEQEYTLFWNHMGTHDLRLKIYEKGMKDGSLFGVTDWNTEEEYFCESFFGFFSNLAMSFKLHSKEEIERQLEQRIGNTIAIYEGKLEH
jgi:AcrR family transcriptional regulator